MASPQKENGYTPIANELLEAIVRCDLSTRDMRIVLVILRRTYGFQKKVDGISHEQIAEATGYSRRSVIYAVQDLEAKHMISVKRRSEGGAKLPSLIGINKDYEQWVVQNVGGMTKKNREYAKKRMRVVREGGSAKQKGGSAKQRPKVVQNIEKKGNSFAHTKEKRNKESTTKEIPTPKTALEKKEVSEETKEKREMNARVNEIIHEFKGVNPSHKLLYARNSQRKPVERMLEAMGYEKLISIVKFLPRSNASRYAPTITTPAQLEENLGKLFAWAQRQKEGNGKGKEIIGLTA